MHHRNFALSVCLAAAACATARAPSTPAPPPIAPAFASAAPASPALRAAEVAMGEAHYADARRLFDEAARADARDFEAAYGQARVAYVMGDLTAATAALDRALAIREAADALVLRGRALGIQRRFDDGARDLERALELDPRSGPAWAALAVVDVNRGDEAGARRAFAGLAEVAGKAQAVQTYWAQLLSMSPDPVQPQEALDRCTRGHAAAMEGKWEEAQHEALNGLKYARRYEWCIALTAESFWRLGEAERAEGIYRRLLAAPDPKKAGVFADAKGKLAALLLERGKDPTEALALAREALAERGDRPALLDLLARGCEAAGDLACAREASARLLGQRFAPGPMRDEAERRLATTGASPVPAGSAAPVPTSR